MFLYTLLVTILCRRDQVKFCSNDDECRPGYYCELNQVCNWPGHCIGDPCDTCNDCDEDLICSDNKCAALTEPDCGWAGHCLGDPCTDYNDCYGELICTDNKCADVSPAPEPPSEPTEIPIKNGNTATLTYFTDNTFECIGQAVPPEFSVAVNPLLLGYTAEFYGNLNGELPPWCGMSLTLSVNGKVFVGTVIDTCNPLDTEPFPDPVTGEPIGGKCGYSDVIDLHGETGRAFLVDAVGDDFYQGEVDWIIT